VPSFDLLGIEYLRFGSEPIHAALEASETVVVRPSARVFKPLEAAAK